MNVLRIGKIEFGSSARPLDRQGIELRHITPDFRPAAFLSYQADADAITRLHRRGLLTDDQATEARRKLAANMGEVEAVERARRASE